MNASNKKKKKKKKKKKERKEKGRTREKKKEKRSILSLVISFEYCPSAFERGYKVFLIVKQTSRTC